MILYVDETENEKYFIVTGLQFVDNICSVIRLHKSGDEKDIYYEIIKDIVIEI